MIVAVIEQGPWDGLKIEFPDADSMPAVVTFGMAGEAAYVTYEYAWAGEEGLDVEGDEWKGRTEVTDRYLYQGVIEVNKYA